MTKKMREDQLNQFSTAVNSTWENIRQKEDNQKSIYDTYIIAFLGDKLKAYRFTMGTSEIDDHDLIRYIDRAVNYVHKLHGDSCTTCQVLNYNSFQKLNIKPEDVELLDVKLFTSDLNA